MNPAFPQFEVIALIDPKSANTLLPSSTAAEIKKCHKFSATMTTVSTSQITSTTTTTPLPMTSLKY